MNAVTRFVQDVLERAVKTAAQAALLSLGAQNVTHLNALSVHWGATAGLAAGGFIISVLTSLASQPAGDKSSASVLKQHPTSLTPPALPAETASMPQADAVAEAASIFPSA